MEPCRKIHIAVLVCHNCHNTSLTCNGLLVNSISRAKTGHGEKWNNATLQEAPEMGGDMKLFWDIYIPYYTGLGFPTHSSLMSGILPGCMSQHNHVYIYPSNEKDWSKWCV